MGDQKNNTVEQQGVQPGTKETVGIGYITIASDVDRDKFVNYCLSTSTVMIVNESGTLYTKVPVDRDKLKEIDFPLEPKERGTVVIWVKIAKHNSPIIIGTLGKKTDARVVTQEKQWKVQRVSENGYIALDARAGIPEFSIDLQSKVEGQGKINVNILNPNSTAEFNLFVKGSIELFATKSVTLKSNEFASITVVDEDGNEKGTLSYKLEEGWKLVDEFGNKVGLSKDGISLGEFTKAAEKAAMGETTKKKVEEIIDQINKITVPTAFGPSGTPINAPAFTAIKNSLDEILSELVTLNKVKP